MKRSVVFCAGRRSGLSPRASGQASPTARLQDLPAGGTIEGGAVRGLPPDLDLAAPVGRPGLSRPLALVSVTTQRSPRVGMSATKLENSDVRTGNCDPQTGWQCHSQPGALGHCLQQPHFLDLCWFAS